MDSSQQPLVAGLLTSFASTTIAPAIAPPRLASYSHYAHSTPTATPLPPSDHNGHQDGDMHQWSSLIGIVTALIGNVLISLALNIQRYAHLRIAREWEQEKIKQETSWRRTQSGLSTTDSYGGVDIDDARIGQRGRSSDHARHRDFEAYRDGDEDELQGRRRESEVRDPRESFTSDRTARPNAKEESSGDRKSYLKSPYWWAGIILMCLGETGNFLAYGFAPASIVSPLGVVALISNCVIAPCLLKEKFRTRDFWGVLIAIAGAVIVVLSAKSSEEKLGPDEIWRMITRWEFELYMALTIVLMIGLMWASFSYGSRSILIDVGLVAVSGGYTALSTKGVSSLLSFTLWHVITFPITYLLVFVLVSSALLQIRYINRALQRFDSTQVIPTQFVLFTLSVIIGSAVLYRDFESMTAQRAAKFVGGCGLTFLGVYFITSGRIRSDDESTFSTEDEEETIGLLNGERYHDRLDMSPPSHQLRGAKPLHTGPGVAGEAGRSPPGSLLSQGIDGVNENELTPRGVLSAAPSSPSGSLTAESNLSGPSLDGPSPLRPPSRMSNPWAESQDQTLTPKSDTEIYRVVTPPRQADTQGQESTVLLRFPPAPDTDGPSPNGMAAALRRASTPALGDQHNASSQEQPTTTPSRRLRDSMSHRFSPGPLIPTLSGGFSAVVAESLRRGDGSPFKDRSRRRMGRRRQLEGAFYQTPTRSDLADLDANVASRNSALTIANARLQSATSLATPPPEAGQSTPALPTEIYTTPTQKTDEESKRLRSLSDSWSGGLAWLGSALRKGSQANFESGAITSGSVTPQTGENPSAQGDEQHESADTESDTRS